MVIPFEMAVMGGGNVGCGRPSRGRAVDARLAYLDREALRASRFRCADGTVAGLPRRRPYRAAAGRGSAKDPDPLCHSANVVLTLSPSEARVKST